MSLRNTWSEVAPRFAHIDLGGRCAGGLGSQASAELRNKGNGLYVSAATIWELSIKSGIGKLNLSQAFRPWMEKAMSDLGATVLPITIETADLHSSLPPHHRDPFDRMLAAQSITESMPLVSSDAIFDQYGVQRIW